MFSVRFLLAMFVCIVMVTPTTAVSGGHILEPPKGKTILTVLAVEDPEQQAQGTIERTTDGSSALFDLAQLEALGLVEIRTDSPWTDGITRFEGVRIKALVDYLGATGTRVHFLAHDDYEVEIPVTDLDAFGPILATRQDGEIMAVRDRGPIWVIYPWSDIPEIQNDENYGKAIWQVKQMTLK